MTDTLPQPSDRCKGLAQALAGSLERRAAACAAGHLPPTAENYYIDLRLACFEAALLAVQARITDPLELALALGSLAFDTPRVRTEVGHAA